MSLLKFSEEDRGFGDVLSLEYLLHASICARLNNIPSFNTRSNHSDLIRSNSHSICAKHLYSVALEEFGQLPADEILQLRYLVFTIIDQMFFFQHLTCKISEKFIEPCCEEHKYYNGYELACNNFEMLIKHPGFQFENHFSIFQLLVEFKIHLVIQRSSSVEDLHRLARTVLEREVVTLENSKSPCKGIYGSLFAKDYVENCANQCESFLNVDEAGFPTFIEGIRRSREIKTFEQHFGNFLKTYYSRLQEPFIFRCSSSSQEVSEEIDILQCSDVEDNHNIPANANSSPVSLEIQGDDSPKHATPVKGREIPRTPPPIQNSPTEGIVEVPTKKIDFSDSLVIDSKILLELFPRYSSDFTEIVMATHPHVRKYVQSMNLPTDFEQVMVESENSKKHTLDMEKSAKKYRPGGKVPFTDEETSYIIEGVKQFGNNWRRILECFPFSNNRTNVDLKDKARNLRKAGRIP